MSSSLVNLAEYGVQNYMKDVKCEHYMISISSINVIMAKHLYARRKKTNRQWMLRGYKIHTKFFVQTTEVDKESIPTLKTRRMSND